jgi:cytochrome c-type biogenesis protein CcmH
MPGFILLAALMLLAALAFLARPLWRSARTRLPAQARQLDALRQALDAGVINADEYATKRAQLESLAPTTDAPARSRTAFVALLGVLLVLPGAAIALYTLLGEPRALDAANLVRANTTAGAGEHGPEMEQAIAGLAAKMQKNPDDIEGWLLLGRAYKSQQRFVEAREALKNAFERAKDNPDVQVEYAEALALATDSRRLDGEPRRLLELALATSPAHERALWLLGIADFQAEQWTQAIAHWQKLEAVLPADSKVLESVREQIAQARAKAGMPAQTAAAAAPDAPAQTAPTATADAGPQLTVKVSLAPALAAKVSPGDTLFVFAKAAGGPPMPLAVQRLSASALPTTVVLSDGMGMMPNLKLSQFPQVIVGARISKSGNAVAQSGDLQTVSAPLDVKRTDPITLTIDQSVN